MPQRTFRYDESLPVEEEEQREHRIQSEAFFGKRDPTAPESIIEVENIQKEQEGWTSAET